MAKLSLKHADFSPVNLDADTARGPQPPAPSPAPERGRQGDDSKPYCERHNVLMRATSSTGVATHYACPVAGCESKEKRARPPVLIPREPQYCPQRTCQLSPQALEVSPRASNVAILALVCPQCGFESRVPRPHFRPALERHRQQAAAEDLGER